MLTLINIYKYSSEISINNAGRERLSIEQNVETECVMK